MTGLRSAAWFERDDEVALLHRAALRSAHPEWKPGIPVIGIADTASDFNPCNLPIRDLLPVVSDAVRSAGGAPFTFPTMSLGEDLTKPTAMFYRNLVTMQLEESVRSLPIDGLLITAGCDKSVAAAMMVAATVDIPVLIVLSGPKRPGEFAGRPLGSGTDLWRALEERRAGRLGDAGWRELEDCLTCTIGTCNTMGTALTLGLVAEALGLVLPGTTGLEAGSDAASAAAAAAGNRIVSMVEGDVVPSALMNRESIDNALRVVAAVGGSTNAIVHLAAIAGRLAIDFDLLGRTDEVLRSVPLLADIEPSGSGLAPEFVNMGGLPAVASVIPAFDRDVVAADGRKWADVTAAAPAPNEVGPAPTLAVVRGNLAPRGAVIKVSAASRELLTHRGPALVLDDYDTMRTTMDDPDLDLPDDVVLIVRGCGPVGGPGMPEWGMVPIPLALQRRGITDVVRISDGRMSGTSYGTVVLHVAPESAVGGPLALVRDGDMISLDVRAGSLELEVPADELESRLAAWRPAESAHLRGWPRLYLDQVEQADRGCDLRFLTAPTAAHRRFVPPTIGRS